MLCDSLKTKTVKRVLVQLYINFSEVLQFVLYCVKFITYLFMSTRLGKKRIRF
jgi:hypothetical protein